MIKKGAIYSLLLPFFILFASCGGGGDDESGPVTRLQVTVTYNGDLIVADSYLGVALNRTSELIASGGYTLPNPETMPPSVGQQKTPVKGETYVIELTSIPITEGYLFVYLNQTDEPPVGENWAPASGDPYTMYNDKSGAAGQEAEVLVLEAEKDNKITVTFDDSYHYPDDPVFNP